MLKGDYLILIGTLIFLGLSVLSIYYYQKYKNNPKLQLEDFGSSKDYLEKCYYATYFLIPIGLGVFYAINRGPFDHNICIGVYRCFEAHNITWWAGGASISLASLIINRLSKRMLEISKNRS